MEKNFDYNEFLNENYGGKIRVRVVGVCEKEGKYLLINHLGINNSTNFWCGPGGGVKPNESLEEAVKREFLEEANIVVKVGKQLGLYEYIQMPLHAIEVFFGVTILGGNLKLGHDPETETQILKDLKWFSIEEMKNLQKNELHQHFLKQIF